MKKRKNNTQKYLSAIIIVLVIIAIIFIVAIRKNKKKKNENISTNSKNMTIQETEQTDISQEDEIKTLTESKRIKRYIGIFFDNIENGDYETEYNKLNEEFKNTYFPTLDSFEEYVNRYLNPSIIGVSYDNFERLGNNKTGNMYVVWLTIGNIYQRKLTEDEELEQTNFIILEHNYNNYELSFSVNEE